MPPISTFFANWPTGGSMATGWPDVISAAVPKSPDPSPDPVPPPNNAPGGGNDCPPGYTKQPGGMCAPTAPPTGWDCPPGQVFSKAANGGKGGCVAAGGGAPSGGGGFTGGGGAAAGASFQPSGNTLDWEKLVGDYIKRLLAQGSRYTPQVMQSLFGQVTRHTAGAIESGERAVRADAARRGMQRAGSTGAALRDVRSQAEAAQGAANVGIMHEKVKADFTDKLAALDRAQTYLNSLRDSEYRYMLAAEQRRQFDANLTLAYANLQNQWDMLNTQMGYQVLLLGV